MVRQVIKIRFCGEKNGVDSILNHFEQPHFQLPSHIKPTTTSADRDVLFDEKTRLLIWKSAHHPHDFNDLHLTFDLNIIVCELTRPETCKKSMLQKSLRMVNNHGRTVIIALHNGQLKHAKYAMRINNVITVSEQLTRHTGTISACRAINILKNIEMDAFLKKQFDVILAIRAEQEYKHYQTVIQQLNQFVNLQSSGTMRKFWYNIGSLIACVEHNTNPKKVMAAGTILAVLYQNLHLFDDKTGELNTPNERNDESMKADVRFIRKTIRQNQAALRTGSKLWMIADVLSAILIVPLYKSLKNKHLYNVFGYFRFMDKPGMSAHDAKRELKLAYKHKKP